MDTPRRIVVALDKTNRVESKAALHWALASLIRPGTDRVMLLHVTNFSHASAEIADRSPWFSAGLKRQLLQDAKEELQHYADVCASRTLLAESKALWGSVQLAVHTTIEVWRATHLVMGTGGKKRGKFQTWMRGPSLTSKILSLNAKCTVLLINKQARLHLQRPSDRQGGQEESVPLPPTEVDDGGGRQDVESEPQQCPCLEEEALDCSDASALSPEALAERLALLERESAKVEAWREEWTVDQSLSAADKEHAELTEEVPDLFVCPIAQSAMSDPVLAADGHVYERSNIARWMQHKQSSPLTNLPLPDCFLAPVDRLTEAISDWKKHRVNQ